jgi:hypothetical protein
MRTEQLVGILLVALGAFLFVVFQTGVGGEAVPLFIGVAFSLAFATTRNYGLLVPAAILTGLGTGIVTTAAGGPESSPVLGLGLGFLAIYGIDRLAHGRGASWWPLIPGGILTVVGVTSLPAVRSLVPYVVPLAVVAAGIWLLLAGGRRQATRTPPAERDASR